ncbi:MAG TPA: DUF3017 domain-containing protein [Dermatophilaceae bacterium]|nr:DUF3017 domain-containing protein [Dermatophilaceae bacterium]
MALPSRWQGLRRLGLWWAVAAVVALGLVISAFGRLRAGGYLMALALSVGAVARLASGKANGLAVRRRVVDAFCLFGLAGALVVVFSLVRIDE